jgi:multidrug efflux pump subunit AcrA (membrane-fusion protein)
MLIGVTVVAWLASVCLAADDPRGLPLKLVIQKVQRGPLQPQIIERGTVESARNTYINCTVKPVSRGAGAATIIKWVIDDGSSVKKGDPILELDDSDLQDQLKNQKLAVDKAEADKTKAEQDYQIQVSQNESDLGTAQVSVQLAQLDLEKYLKADQDLARHDIQGRVLQAEADVEQLTNELERAETALKQKQLTDSQVRVVRLRLEAAQLALKKGQLELEVFSKYARPRLELDLRSKVAEGQRGLERLKQMLKVRETAARQFRESARSIYQQERTRYQDIEGEIKKCKIVAPQDGMVLYYVPEQVRGGFGAQQSIIAQGEPVREGQKLLSIPDLSKMQIMIRVPEALASQVRVGQPAVVRIDAYPDRTLRGKVHAVATVPSARDWLTADEKVYATVIALDGDTTGLRPGLSGTVTLTVGKALDNILAVPARALIGRGAFGKLASCLVLTADGPEEREVVVGLRNEQVAEITSGLRAGDEVIVNPQVFLNDIRDRIRFLRSGRPASRRGE